MLKKLINLLKDKFLCYDYSWEVKMARIIESENGGRRIIKMSVDDILSVVRDYQNIVPRFSSAEDTRSYLSDTVIYLPEDI